MKWRTVLCTALFLCGTVLFSACGGGEMPAPAEPPASSEGSAPSQPEEVPAPSESASSSEPEPLPEPELPKPWDGMVVPEGCKAEWKIEQGKLVLVSYEFTNGSNVLLPTGKPYSIGANCFMKNWKLTGITIPEDVVEIQQSAFQESGLKQIYIPASVKKLKNDIFADCYSLTTATIENTPMTGQRIFARCSVLQSVRLGEGVIRIEEGAFEHSGLKKITLPGTLSNVEKYAFDYCNLKTIVYNGDWEAKKSTLTIGEQNEALLTATQS